jgi:hypothetical protein
VNQAEISIATAFRDATADLVADADVADRARLGGRRRLRRRRIAAVVGAGAVAVAAVPAGIAVAHVGGARPTPAAASHSFLYATPPTAANPCDLAGRRLDDGGPANPASYPQLLMLPEGRAVSYAFTNNGGAPQCTFFPHIALTLLHTTGGIVTRSVEIDGPNALNPSQAGLAPSRFSGGWGNDGNPAFRQLHPSIHGHEADVYDVVTTRHADAFWAGDRGSRWHATATGLSARRLDVLLNAVVYNPHTGTARLPGAAGRGWTVAPSAPDARGPRDGVFYALWHQDGGKVALFVIPAPDRIDQFAQRRARLVTVHHRPAVTYPVGRHGYQVMRWQVRPGVTAYLSMTHSSAATLEAVAATIRPVNPSDPRLHRP